MNIRQFCISPGEHPLLEMTKLRCVASRRIGGDRFFDYKCAKRCCFYPKESPRRSRAPHRCQKPLTMKDVRFCGADACIREDEPNLYSSPAGLRESVAPEPGSVRASGGMSSSSSWSGSKNLSGASGRRRSPRMPSPVRPSRNDVKNVLALIRPPYPIRRWNYRRCTRPSLWLNHKRGFTEKGTPSCLMHRTPAVPTQSRRSWHSGHHRCPLHRRPIRSSCKGINPGGNRG